MAMLLSLLAFLGSAVEEGLPPEEKKKIEALIEVVEKLPGAKMLRNGAEYDAKTAGRFLRGKWDSSKKQIKSVQDFLDKAATVSSTSGKPYEILFGNGKKVTAKEFFLEELERLKKKE
ncbi:MAG: hypothetical protein EXR99_07275 [Gemmataceae bacterium]|nr:hypothetical protein [Gemmataceae bacterium]